MHPLVLEFGGKVKFLMCKNFKQCLLKICPRLKKGLV